MDLHGHRALITGAAQGIGRACAMVFGDRGADLVLLDRNGKGLEKVRDELAGRGGAVDIQVMDLMDLDRTGEAFKSIRQLASIDILVNNAGFDRPGTAAQIARQDFEAVMNIHVTAGLMLIQALLPGMQGAGWGRIVNVSSIYGAIGAKGEVAYSTAKAAILGLTKSVAREAGPDGVTVNAVLPGLTRTPTIETYMADRYKQAIIRETPLARMAEPEEIARVIAFLASNDASYITGAAIPVSGGWGI